MTEIYRKQAARLDELERENKRLGKEVREADGRWKKTEEELEELREARSELAELKARAEKADAKNEEIEKLVCERNSYFPHLAPITHYNSHLETRKHLSSTPKLPTTIPIIERPACVFTQPSQCLFIRSANSARFQKFNHRINGNGNLQSPRTT